MTSEAAVMFTTLYPGKFVEIEGLPFEDGSSEWHVNDHLHLGVSEDVVEAMLQALSGRRHREPNTVVSHAIILQRSDASEEWIGVIVRDADDGLTYDRAFHFATGREVIGPEEFDPVGLDVEVIEDV